METINISLQTEGLYTKRTLNGLPVYHIPGGMILDQVRSYANLYQYNIHFAEGLPCDEYQQPARGRTVLTIGAEVAEAGAYYAFLTSRRHLNINAITDIADLENVDCIILLSDKISEVLFKKIISTPKRTPGLIPAPSLGVLYEILTTKAIQVNYPPRKSSQKMAHFSYGGHDQLTQGISLLDTASTATEIRNCFSKDNAVLGITSHSDGIDLSLGPLVLCPISTGVFEKAGDTRGAPPCVQQRYCHRVQLSFDVLKPKKERYLFSCLELKARILFLNTCESLKLTNGVVDDEYYYIYLLLRNIHICYIISTWKIIYGFTETVNKFISLLSETKDCGKALFALNSSAPPGAENILFTCLGDTGIDPDIRQMKTVRMSKPHEDIRLSKEMGYDLQFYHLFVNDQLKRMKTSKPSDRRGFFTKKLDLIGELFYSSEYIFKSTGEKTRFIGKAQKEMAEIFQETGHFFFKSWSRFSLDKKMSYGEGCVKCGFTIENYTYHFGGLLGERTLSLCPCCGVLRDGPDSMKTVLFEHKGEGITVSNIRGENVYLTVLQHRPKFPHKNFKIPFAKTAAENGDIYIRLKSSHGKLQGANVIMVISDLSQPLFYYSG